MSVKENGITVHKQKQLVLHNLKELYLDINIGFTKFCELRPKHCVLANASGTHAVYVRVAPEF